ncbi:hypothetical protein [Bdellovibrio bacteriovorus]|uniref:hypothetical protein n=1 Tax=Bdellovibrio bacteriovorus TaxID=959 RepID=UPI0035A97C1E
MKTAKIIGSIALMSILSACAGENDSNKGTNTSGVTSEGDCSQEIIDVSNDLLDAMQGLEVAMRADNPQEAVERAKVVRKACNRIFPRYEGVTCRAELDGEIVDLKTNDVKQYCTRVKEFLRSREL